ncbi:hypothetical protein M409DRAFT_27972 [Zasmidium cellare ATCC 36951]|uniref:Uncharacterized protein n=1 Tax=Zasmidium cellare ATCC 36951 TaxID=1080233 RepID=A0A6A6C368_ZASCE|nr:uncharacterized protein M409DRAFT_27972 [Zasmidium cellare ATCC 36951]KAF2161577.1 hypothetical protein M409DRAFT_27972 [Zasmidium cellare ATCC 36951]
MPNPPSSSHCTFLALPPPLRLRIYEAFAATLTDPAAVDYSLLETCQQIDNEAAPIFTAAVLRLSDQWAREEGWHDRWLEALPTDLLRFAQTLTLMEWQGLLIDRRGGRDEAIDDRGFFCLNEETDSTAVFITHFRYMLLLLHLQKFSGIICDLTRGSRAAIASELYKIG